MKRPSVDDSELTEIVKDRYTSHEDDNYKCLETKESTDKQKIKRPCIDDSELTEIVEDCEVFEECVIEIDDDNFYLNTGDGRSDDCLSMGVSDACVENQEFCETSAKPAVEVVGNVDESELLHSDNNECLSNKPIAETNKNMNHNFKNLNFSQPKHFNIIEDGKVMPTNKQIQNVEARKLNQTKTDTEASRRHTEEEPVDSEPIFDESRTDISNLDGARHVLVF